MKRTLKKQLQKVTSLAYRPKAGLPPGSVIYTGDAKLEKALITRTEFNQENYRFFEGEKGLESVREDRIQWIDIRGLHDTDLLLKVGELFSIHPLILEDVANTFQRPKFEEYPKSLFFTSKAFQFDEKTGVIIPEQVSIFVKDRLIISFQENKQDIFQPIRERIQNKSGRIRNRNSDYLAYAMLDLVVDSYFHILDTIGEENVDLEIDILDNTNESIKRRLHKLKKQLIILRKGLAPLRESVSQFSRSEHVLIQKDTPIFLRDLYDHSIQVLDLLEAQRDTLNGLYELFLSELSFRMNNIMKVLTIIATIFIPLTFLAGIYGMNFEYMPELSWKYGYFYLLGIMAILFLLMLGYFKRRNWL